MLVRIDHIVIAVEDLEEAAAELQARLGIAVRGGGRHPRLGTENRLAWLGDSYIELVTVFDRDLGEESWLGRPTVEALAQGGRLVTWAVTSDSIAADVAALRDAGSDLAAPIPGERVRPDGRVVRWQLSVPGRLGPTEPPFLIEHDTNAAEWSDVERAERAAAGHPLGGPVRLEVLELPMANVPAAIQSFGRAVGLRFRPSLAGGGGRAANVGAQIVRLRPAGPDAIPAIELSSPAGDGRESDLFGVRWRVRRSG
jgi:hypothetical protein